MGWCNDSKSKLYNKEILIDDGLSHEKLYRTDHKYDFILVIDYNIKNTIPYNGSAIFLHLTKDYKPTAGCIAVSKKDFLILLKLINNRSFIKIY